MDVAALAIQSDVREVASIERFGHSLRWVEESAALDADVPLIVTGSLAVSHAKGLRRIIRGRMRGGLGTLMVPRFRPCNLAEVLAAPSDIEVFPLESEAIKWNHNEYRVPGSVLFRTKLHVNKWAIIPGAGVQLMAFQPTTARGRVLLCSAAVTSRRVGSIATDQRRLLDALLALCVVEKKGPSKKPVPTDDGPLSPAELLARYPEPGPGLLISILFGASPKEPEQVCERARCLVGVELSPEVVERLARRMQGNRNEIEAALTTSGWSAFVRKAKQFCPEVQYG